jgi:hypothetical protein
MPAPAALEPLRLPIDPRGCEALPHPLGDDRPSGQRQPDHPAHQRRLMHPTPPAQDREGPMPIAQGHHDRQPAARAGPLRPRPLRGRPRGERRRVGTPPPAIAVGDSPAGGWGSLVGLALKPLGPPIGLLRGHAARRQLPPQGPPHGHAGHRRQGPLEIGDAQLVAPHRRLDAGGELWGPATGVLSRARQTPATTVASTWRWRVQTPRKAVSAGETSRQQ